MRMKVFGAVVLASVFGSAMWAQIRGGGSEWLTAGSDAQRTSWIRNDAAISVDAVTKPGFELQWKVQVDNQPRGLSSLGQGVTANGVTLFVPMSLVTGSSNNIYAIDNEIGHVVWQRHFDAPLPAATAACPGGISSPATRIVDLTPPLPSAGRAGGGGRGAGYRSSVGEPGEGAPVDAPRGGGPGRGAAPAAPPAGAPAAGAPPAGAPPAGAPVAGAAAAGAPPAGAPAGGAAPAGGPPVAGQAPGAGAGRGAAPAAGQGRGVLGNAGIPGAPGGLPGAGYGRPAGVVYSVASDGMLHVLGLQTGKDLQKPAAFLPANARASDLIAVNETLYAATTGGCAGAPNGVWAIGLASEAKPVTSWQTNGGGVTGLAFATNGTLLAVVGAGQAAAGGYANAIVALDPATLQVKDWFTDPKSEFSSAPLVFKSNDKDIVAAATRDGRILLLDVASLGGANHATPLFASRSFATAGTAFEPEALATWQDMSPAPGSSPNTTSAPTTPAAQAPPPQGAPPAGVPQGPLTTLQGAPGTPGGAPTAAPASRMQPGTRWLLVPVSGALPPDAQLPGGNAIKNGAIVALRVVEEGGKVSLQPGWVSRDLASPATPLIVNGVVFALASGKPQLSGGTLPGDVAKRGSPAVLYALNGADGKDLWNSGKTITSFLSGRSLWSATGQVYVGAFDGTIYAFGAAMDRK